ncbi:TetR/AcrR family transcriptional regulator [Gandjariella thermophila]|uniref:TetR/AcrR family transcriptional regulator n=1 Tax=Gandjariella thermophila TaxID=1931992 RepID=UPI0010F6BF4E|nr:TetR/AcrR family transcriptional regulator [Gandjariella thermophila]
MQSRRLEYAEATRQALVDSAVELFTERGYTGTSLDEIAKLARVTKGALYHHFSGKQALFEAAFDAVETRVMAHLGAIVAGPGDPWQTAMAGIEAYVKVCLEPSFQRIVIHEAPVVMGWEAWRECEERYSFGVLRAAIKSLIDAGEIEDMPVEITTQLLFGALSAGAHAIASATDPEQAGAEVARAVSRVVTGLRRRDNDPAGRPAAGGASR